MQEYLDEKVKKYTLSAPENRKVNMNKNILVSLITTLVASAILLLLSVPISIILQAFFLDAEISIWFVWASLMNMSLLYGYIESIKPSKYIEPKHSTNGKVIHRNGEN